MDEDKKKKMKKDPYEEIIEILKGYDEGLPKRSVKEMSDCSCCAKDDEA